MKDAFIGTLESTEVSSDRGKFFLSSLFKHELDQSKAESRYSVAKDFVDELKLFFSGSIRAEDKCTKVSVVGKEIFDRSQVGFDS